jgi:hypothetical protein
MNSWDHSVHTLHSAPSCAADQDLYSTATHDPRHNVAKEGFGHLASHSQNTAYSQPYHTPHAHMQVNAVGRTELYSAPYMLLVWLLY